jgi:IS5 family transposase
MATREKALVDLIENRRNIAIRSVKQMRTRLIEDLRIDESKLFEFNLERAVYYASLYGSVKTMLLAEFLMDLKGEIRSE